MSLARPALPSLPGALRLALMSGIAELVRVGGIAGDARLAKVGTAGTLARIDRRPVMRQSWRDLLFLHQPVPAELLRRLVPKPLVLESFQGETWATLIPFEVERSRPAGVPAPLGMSFLETNLRTYVRSPQGEPGIFFFSLEASSWLAVAGARAAYALPYFPARMLCRKDVGPATLRYASRRRLGGGAGLEATWRIGSPTGHAVPGTLEHFLIERYVLFTERRGTIWRAQVRHRPYPLCDVSLEAVRETLFARAGLPALPTPPPLAHFSPGVDVDIFWRTPLP